MILTEEQARNNYPLQAVKFMQTFDKYLSEDVDDYGLKTCALDSFNAFKEIDAEMPKSLRSDYERYIKEIHDYLDKGFDL